MDALGAAYRPGIARSLSRFGIQYNLIPYPFGSSALVWFRLFMPTTLAMIQRVLLHDIICPGRLTRSDSRWSPRCPAGFTHARYQAYMPR